ncbi:MAG: MGMT family protein [Oligoflexia bacterium]|nr:MGMT family protein [Oligoflexia bacterium]
MFKQATPFQVKVWKACAKIPAGKTMSYKELAKAIGHPKASRAVGSALGKNPLLYKIPCHRVLTSNGKLGGYSCKFGLKGKKLLLDIERP